MCPDGWLMCDGRGLNSYDYPKLFTAIGTIWGDASEDSDPYTDFRLPDCRGSFLRGVSGASGIDPDIDDRVALNLGGNVGNAVGSFQNDELKSHVHDYQRASGSSACGAVFWIEDKNTANDVWVSRFSTSMGGAETRPKNIAVNFFIKY